MTNAIIECLVSHLFGGAAGTSSKTERPDDMPGRS
jgi:hypothetical protein